MTETISCVSSSAVFSAQGIAIHAGDKPLLRNFNIDLNAGEIVSLEGPSGCGKTTLLRALAGLVDTLTGEVFLGGKNRNAGAMPAFRRRAIYVEQTPKMFDVSVEANLRRPFEYAVDAKTYDGARAAELFARLQLEPERLTQNARSLSVGQQQRVSLVRALLLEPDVLLLDEPTSALDEANVASMESLLREEVTRRAMGTLVICHDTAQAARWCDRRIDLRACMVAEATHE